MKVFVSSTCYDLIDLRLELAEEHRATGCRPMLSDERASDFEVSGAAGENSIQTRLNNVRQSDAVVVVLRCPRPTWSTARPGPNPMSGRSRSGPPSR